MVARWNGTIAPSGLSENATAFAANAGAIDFPVRVRAERQGRNPKTGAKVHIPKRRTLSFTVGKELRDRLNRAPEESAPAQPELQPAPASGARSAPSGMQSAEPLAAALASLHPRYTLGWAGQAGVEGPEASR